MAPTPPAFLKHMRRPRDLALRAGFYIAAALSGFAAAYVLKQWASHIWDKPDRVVPDDETHPREPDKEHSPDPPSKTPPPPIRTHALPPPIPSVSRFFPANADSSTPSTVFAESVHEDAVEQQGVSTSDTDSFVDVLSPPPTHVPRRHSVRAHDLFAESHISFTELGSLIAPQSDPNSN